MDSMAAHSIVKLKTDILGTYGVEVTMLISGSLRESFPCQCALREAIEKPKPERTDAIDLN